jgi:hypothetical protein
MRTFLVFCFLLLAVWPARQVNASEFVPASALFGDARDGGWEFPAAMALVSPAEQQTEDAASASFQFGIPGNVERAGKVLWHAQEGGFVRLNDPQEPEFLVRNRLSWQPAAGESREAWLRFEYRLWSEETERGFDAPGLVLYQENRLIYQEDIGSRCAIESCLWRSRRVYLGQTGAPFVFHFFAGEMGDSQKPSGVDLRGMKLEVKREPTFNSAAPGSPTPSLAAAAQEIARPSFAVRPQAVPTTHVVGNEQSAAVLGAQDAVEQPSAQTPSLLEKIVFHPILYVLLWAVSFLVIALVWHAFEKRRNSIKHFLKKGEK